MMRLQFCAALLLIPTCCNAAEEIYPGYTWHALGNDIYLHSQNDPLAGPVDGNSIVILNEDGVVVVDTHINPAVARAVIQKVRELTDAPVTHVVNTHWHDDHANGNHAYRHAFPNVRIIAHADTLKSLRGEWAAMEEQRRAAYAKVDPDELLAAAASLHPKDPTTAISYRLYAGYVSALRSELPTLQLEYPDTVFEQTSILEFSHRRVELRWLGRGNTDGDIVVWLPGERVLLTGDMLVAPIPFAFDSPMVDWVDTLKRLGEMEPRLIVPGHGAAQYDSNYLKAVLALLEATIQRVQAAYASGVAFADLEKTVDLGDFRSEFAGENPERLWAWESYFVRPAVKSAWTSLEYPLPEE
jgi:glyoxylase-like metal-dependent hydrolase (beta-lactamase superfamily II)